MLEKVKPFDIERPETIKIKGRTRIELTTVKTGEKKIIEHENVFQSQFLASFLRSFGAANNNPFSNATWKSRPVWRNLCGGVFLFRDAITAPAEYMPAGNLMVANGSFGVTNSSNPPELGSYNSIESSTSGSNSLSFVYDWGTSQGNGTISCVCLTSETGGYIGYGNESGYSANLRSLLENQDSSANGARFFYNGKKYNVLAVDMTNKKVTIEKSIDQITKVSIFQGQDGAATEYTYTGDVAGNSSSGTIMTRRLSETEFAIIKCNQFQSITLANGSAARFLVFNVSTNTLRVQEITNTSGADIRICEAATSNVINLIADSTGNYYMSKSNGELAKFSSAGVYQGIVSTHTAVLAPKGILTPELLYTQPGYSNGDAMWIYDGTNERITNGFAMESQGAQIDYIAGIDAICYASRAAYDLSPFKNPLYLATINNLDSPITKDSTQTMKVVYTLTEANA